MLGHIELPIKAMTKILKMFSKGDTVEAADSVYHETDYFWNGEDIVMQGDVDPREGTVSDWDLLAEEIHSGGRGIW